jgi:hypothetical protein
LALRTLEAYHAGRGLMCDQGTLRRVRQ